MVSASVLDQEFYVCLQGEEGLFYTEFTHNKPDEQKVVAVIGPFRQRCMNVVREEMKGLDLSIGLPRKEAIVHFQKVMNEVKALLKGW